MPSKIVPVFLDEAPLQHFVAPQDLTAGINNSPLLATGILPVPSNRRAGSPSYRDYWLKACPTILHHAPILIGYGQLLGATINVDSPEFSEFRLPIAGFMNAHPLLAIVECLWFREKSKKEILRWLISL
jgi:hypothetical protein